MNEVSELLGERAVTVGFLKQQIEKLNLPDDAVLYYDNQQYSWESVGPEGEEVMFVTPAQQEVLEAKVKQLMIDKPFQFRRKVQAMIHVYADFKKESGQ